MSHNKQPPTPTDLAKQEIISQLKTTKDNSHLHDALNWMSISDEIESPKFSVRMSF